MAPTILEYLIAAFVALILLGALMMLFIRVLFWKPIPEEDWSPRSDERRFDQRYRDAGE